MQTEYTTALPPSIQVKRAKLFANNPSMHGVLGMNKAREVLTQVNKAMTAVSIHNEQDVARDADLVPTALLSATPAAIRKSPKRRVLALV